MQHVQTQMDLTTAIAVLGSLVTVHGVKESMKLAMVLFVMHRLSVSNRTINHGSANAIRAGRVMDRLAQMLTNVNPLRACAIHCELIA